MTAVSFGYGKTYAWDDHGASVNLQNTNITLVTGSDGWKVKSFATPQHSTDWDALTGWTETSGAGTDSEISPAGQLHQYANTAGNTTQLVSAGMTDASSALCYLSLTKIAAYSVSTSTASDYGIFNLVSDGVGRSHYAIIRSDGTYIDIYAINNAGSTFTHYDTTQPIDTSRFHIQGLYCNNADADDRFIWDGAEIISGMQCWLLNLGAAFYFNAHKAASGDPNVEHHTEWTKYWSSINPWQTTDGTWTSTYNDAIFDAGLGSRWSAASFTTAIPATTGVTIQVRTADTAAGLLTATYFSATSGVAFDVANRKRFIQVLATQTNSSGRYTSILKDLALTPETVYQSWGEWVSRSYDLGTEVNNLGSGATITWGATVPATSLLMVQTKTADSSADLATAQWGANDGTGNFIAGAWYPASGSLVKLQLGYTGKRWVKFRVTMTPSSDLSYSPTLNSLILNYTTGYGTPGFVDVSADLCGSFQYDGDMRNFVSQQIQFQINNTDRAYSYGGSKYPLVNKGNVVKFSVGTTIAGETYYLPIFHGCIETRPNEGVTLHLTAMDDNWKLPTLPTPTGIFGPVYSWLAIQAIYQGLGFTLFDFDQTILTTLPNGRWFQSSTFADQAVQKLLETICARLWITPIGVVKLRARNSSTTPDFTIDDSMILWNGVSITPYENLMSRITAINTENLLTENAEQIIGTASGTLAAGTASSTVTISFTQAPIIKIRCITSGTATVTELSRSCGYYGANGNIQLTVTNPNYPNGSATYSITAYGRPIQTTDATIKFSEQLSQALWDAQKGQDVTVNNRFLGNQAAVDNLVGVQMSDYGTDFNKIEVETCFLPLLEFNDGIQLGTVLVNLSRVYYLMAIHHAANMETGKWTSKFELMDKNVTQGAVLYDTTGVNYDSVYIYDYYL